MVICIRQKNDMLPFCSIRPRHKRKLQTRVSIINAFLLRNQIFTVYSIGQIEYSWLKAKA